MLQTSQSVNDWCFFSRFMRCSGWLGGQPAASTSRTPFSGLWDGLRGRFMPAGGRTDPL